MIAGRSLVAACLLLGVASVHAQDKLGELLDKGAKKLVKADYAALFPVTLSYTWPDKQGEGEVHFKSDGTLTGTEYHKACGTNSPAVGTWTVDDNGKWCIKKYMARWNRNSDVCWYSFVLNDAYFSTLSDSDRDARVVPAGSFKK